MMLSASFEQWDGDAASVEATYQLIENQVQQFSASSRCRQS